MKQKRIIGNIVKIPLGEGVHTYARTLKEASFAIYDARTKEEITNFQALIKKPILFVVAVYNDAITSHRWENIFFIPLEPNLLILPKKFIQDPINPNKFRIYDNGRIIPASKDECLGLERASVWEPEQVEQRIRDYYAGRPNQWIELDKNTFR